MAKNRNFTGTIIVFLAFIIALTYLSGCGCCEEQDTQGDSTGTSEDQPKEDIPTPPPAPQPQTPPPPPNTPPKIKSTIPDKTVNEDSSSWTLNLNSYGWDNETAASQLAWTVDFVNPELMTVTISSSNYAQFTLVKDAYGTNEVVFKVADAGGLYASQAVKITVTPVKDAPKITSTAVTTATAGSAYAYQAQASDPDGTTTFDYSLTSAPSGMSINRNNGLITWTPTNETKVAQVNIQVKDPDGMAATQNFVITVS